MLPQSRPQPKPSQQPQPNYEALEDFRVAEETRIVTIATLTEAETHDEPPGLPRRLLSNIPRRILDIERCLNCNRQCLLDIFVGILYHFVQ